MLMFASDLVGSGFNPGMLSGNVAWYDFTNSAYLTLSSTAITQALDRSGNGNNTGIQGTAGARPTFTTNQINGLPSAVFDGGDQLLLPAALFTIPNSGSTTFAVSKRNTETGVSENVITMQQLTVTRTWGLFYPTTSGSVSFRNNLSAVDVTSTGNINTGYQIMRGRHLTTTQAISINNGTETTSAAGNVSTSNVGWIGTLNSTAFLIGGIAEIIIFNRSLTAGEMTQVSRYLSFKYGIAI